MGSPLFFIELIEYFIKRQINNLWETEETNDFDILQGKKINDMERQFNKRLEEIETNHKDYFHKRSPKYPT